MNVSIMTTGGGARRLIRTVLAAASVVAVCAGVAVAQDDDVEEFTGERVRKMRDVAPDAASFDGAFDGESVPADTKPPEFIPKNEITIIPQKVDTAAADTAKKGKGGAPKKSANAVGARLGFGNTFNLGGHFKIGLNELERIDAGISLGFGFGNKGYSTTSFEAAGFYEWRFGISDDGVLGWYGGPGIVFGYYGASGKKTVFVRDTSVTPPRDVEKNVKEKDAQFGVGIGGQIGLEVNMSFIDHDHSLYKLLKDSALSMDIRPMFYWPIVYNYPVAVITMGLAYRFAF